MDRQPKKITALYCRLAHYHSEADTLSAYAQMEALLQYANAHNLENPHFFCDWGYNGTSDDRPEYLRMLQETVNGNISNLVVLELSRLSRDLEKVWQLIDNIPHYQITFHSIQNGGELNETPDTFRMLQVNLQKICRRFEERGQK